MSDTKQCTACGLHLPLCNFGKAVNKSDGLQSWCKPCTRAAGRRSEIKPGVQERRKEYFRQRALDGRQHDLRLRVAFGIDLKEYQRMLAEQGGVCAICKGPQERRKHKNFAVDHCHETGKVRGLLCSSCNSGIGLLKEDRQVLQAAINYLGGQENEFLPFTFVA